jgi:uncharacterized LabA/DUF88 family protein
LSPSSRVLATKCFYKKRRFNSSSWACGIAVDTINILDRVDTVVFASSDNDLLPLMDDLRRRGVEVVVIGTSVSRDIRLTVNEVIELDETLLSVGQEVVGEVTQTA